MRRRPLLISLALSILWTSLLQSACGDVSIYRPPPREGDDPGECSDGADNDGNGLFDCADPACVGADDCLENQRPAGHSVRIDPAEPRTLDDLLCVVATAAVDPEGDVVNYSYAWEVDGTDAEISGAVVSAEQTSKGEYWTCWVTPSDELGAGGGVSAATEISNTPPTMPEVGISPSSPIATDLLHCVVWTPSEDVDGDEVTYEFEWFRNGSFFQNGQTVDWTDTAALEQWSCRGIPSDGTDQGPSDEAVVEVVLGGTPHVTSGRYHSCGMPFDGDWSCWGIADGSSQDFGQATGTIPEVLFMVVAGENHTCAISLQSASTGCWGDNSLNQTQANNAFFMQIGAGYDHTCAVPFDGETRCWGSTTWWTSSPPTSPAFSVTGGYEFSCALMADFSVECWWGNVPVQFPDPPGEWQQIDAGEKHLCGVQMGVGECVGDDTYGQVSELPSGVIFDQISAGHHHSCGVETGTGFVHCWGEDLNGQVSQIPSGAFVTVDAGWSQSCGIRDNGTFECWGCDGDDKGQCTP